MCVNAIAVLFDIFNCTLFVLMAILYGLCLKADYLLNFLKYVCKLRPVDTNAILKSIIELIRPDCIQECGHKASGIKFHPKCTICKDIIKDMKQKIESSPIETDLEIRLQSLCDLLPNKKACMDFVEKYTDKLLNILINDINEESVCKEIGYC